MAKSALLKSSLAKKYWMALTGLFLCLFLVGHLLGNLQLIWYKESLHFNQYALFMTTNPAVKMLSYLTYFSILFHSVDGIALAYQNTKARPVGYVKNSPSANSTWASRSMAYLGSFILIFIVLHMKNFWAGMHFDKKFPIQTITVDVMGQKQDLYVLTNGSYVPVNQVASSYEEAKKNGQGNYFEDRTDIYNAQARIKVGEGYKDLYKITVDFFRDPTYGLLYTILYVLSMAVLALHLDHGFASAFQSLGLSHPKYSGFISKFGRSFAYIVCILFASIPVYVHFFLK